MPNRITRGKGLVGSLTVTGDVAADSFVFGNRQASVAKPTGGSVQDTEARAALDDVIDALVEVGILDEG